MISLFNRASRAKVDRPNLPSLDASLYPLTWPTAPSLDQAPSVFESPNDLLMAVLTRSQPIDQHAFWQCLYADPVYQDWINFTVFGRYIQRSFTAFYRQSEDSFNADMPELLRYELMRHAQYLPEGQVLFFGGRLPIKARQEKLITTTLNPLTALKNACAQSPTTSSQTVINLVTTKSRRVSGFAVRHNHRTSERLRSEVMVLDFHSLRLVNEQQLPGPSQMMSVITLRYYELR